MDRAARSPPIQLAHRCSAPDDPWIGVPRCAESRSAGVSTLVDGEADISAANAGIVLEQALRVELAVETPDGRRGELAVTILEELFDFDSVSIDPPTTIAPAEAGQAGWRGSEKRRVTRVGRTSRQSDDHLWRVGWSLWPDPRRSLAQRSEHAGGYASNPEHTGTRNGIGHLVPDPEQ